MLYGLVCQSADSVVLVDHVVGRRDQLGERAGDALVVAERAKRGDRGHGRRLPKRRIDSAG